MASWNDFASEAPELAGTVRDRLTATAHHVLATLRADGSPRVSGTEVEFVGPDLVLGSMAGARKAHDLRRDGRFALHANPGDGSSMTAGGDVKLSGHAVEEQDSPELRAQREQQPGSHRFRLDLREVVVTSVHPDGDRLVIRWWRPDTGVRTLERS